jgi:hypothetical protein
MIKPLAFILLLTLSACTDHHRLTACRGSIVSANPGKWQPAPEDLKP